MITRLSRAAPSMIEFALSDLGESLKSDRSDVRAIQPGPAVFSIVEEHPATPGFGERL